MREILKQDLYINDIILRKDVLSMSKKKRAIGWLLSMIILFSACNGIPKLSGIEISNSKKAKFSKTYDVQDLSRFFKGFFDISEVSAVDIDNSIPEKDANDVYNMTIVDDDGSKIIRHYIEDVNEMFPIEVLRKIENPEYSEPIEPINENYYSLYKLTDNGYYYVIWSKNMGTLSDDYGRTRVKRVGVLPGKCTKEDYISIQKGSTMLDVLKIDSQSLIYYNTVFSQLNDGSAIEITFGLDGSKFRDTIFPISYEEFLTLYIVSSIEYIPKESNNILKLLSNADYKLIFG